MRVLVVDDSPDLRRVTARLLERLGFMCVEAEDGVQALEFFDGLSLFLVVTDREMPNMDGIELVKAIRAREDGKNVPILMVSGRLAPEDIEEALQVGADGFLAKPFTVSDFEAKIREVLAKPR